MRKETKERIRELKTKIVIIKRRGGRIKGYEDDLARLNKQLDMEREAERMFGKSKSVDSKFKRLAFSII